MFHGHQSFKRASWSSSLRQLQNKRKMERIVWQGLRARTRFDDIGYPFYIFSGRRFTSRWCACRQLTYRWNTRIRSFYGQSGHIWWSHFSNRRQRYIMIIIIIIVITILLFSCSNDIFKNRHVSFALLPLHRKLDKSNICNILR